MKIKKLFNRHFVLSIIFLLLFLRLVIQLADMQITHGDEYKKLSELQKLRKLEIPAPRGNFLDRNGIILAGNRPSFTVELMKNEIVDKSLNVVLLDVIRILEKNSDSFINRFPVVVEYNGGQDDDALLAFDLPVEEDEDLVNEELRWKKKYNIDESLSALEVFEYLKTKYELSEEIIVEDAIKIIAIRLAIDEHGFYRSYIPVEIAEDISEKSVAEIESLSLELPGINIGYKPIRYYPLEESGAHVFGFLSKIQEGEDLKSYIDRGYNLATDMVGATGLEKIMEDQLVGIKGSRMVYVNNRGRIYMEVDKHPPQPGNNVLLTIDKDLQEITERALIDTMEKLREVEYNGKKYPARIGAAVVLNVHTGEVLAMASVPSFDPNLFTTGISSENWRNLNPVYKNPITGAVDRDPTLPRPMINNVIEGAFPGGSTFKMVVGLGALEEKKVRSNETILDQGRYTRYSQTNAPACWIWNRSKRTHGHVNIIDGIRVSCNYYFYEIGYRLGIDGIAQYANKFGLGQRTGIELPGEQIGRVDSADFRRSQAKNNLVYKLSMLLDKKVDSEIEEVAEEMLNRPHWNLVDKLLRDMGIDNVDSKLVEDVWRYAERGRWNPGNTLSVSIGQADSLFTPIQMANYIATIANGGTRYKPHLVKGIINSEGGVEETKPEILETIDISPEHFDVIKEGLYQVTKPSWELGTRDNGTAYSHFMNMPYNVAGKTGTAQFREGREPYSWFVGFAPYEDPQIAVAVIIAEADSSSAPVARAIFDQFMKSSEEESRKIGYNQLAR